MELRYFSLWVPRLLDSVHKYLTHLIKVAKFLLLVYLRPVGYEERRN
jgi:hypothetical protein